MSAFQSQTNTENRRLRILQPLGPSPSSRAYGLHCHCWLTSLLLQPPLYFVSIFKMQVFQWTIWVSWLFLWAKKPDFLQTLLNKTHRAQHKYLNKHDSTSFCSVISSASLHLLSMSISLSSCLSALLLIKDPQIWLPSYFLWSPPFAPPFSLSLLWL